jgi:dihydrofolate reductase
VKELILIAAAGESNELGRDGELPWHLPDDFKYFKERTTGYPMIMGRKTFDTFPRPLPNRRHIIITRDRDYRVKHPDCLVVYSLQEALSEVSGEEKAFVIGGGEIYRQALPHATAVELTRVHGRFEADTYFPELNPGEWQLVRSEYHPKDKRHQYDFTFQRFIPKA